MELTEVIVNPKTVELEVEETEQLNVTVNPSDADQSVTWASSDEGIATVDENGLITAVAEGTATITVKSVNDLTDTATINVSEIPEV